MIIPRTNFPQIIKTRYETAFQTNLLGLAMHPAGKIYLSPEIPREEVDSYLRQAGKQWRPGQNGLILPR